MATKVFVQDNFTGGIAEGTKVGYKGAFQDGIGIDYRSNPDEVTALKKLAKISGSNVTDLIKKMLQDINGNIWGYGDSGKIYKRTTGNSWSNPKTVSSSHGNGMEIFNDELWYAGDAMLGKTDGLAGGSPTFTDDYFRSLTSNAESSQVLTGQTYTTPTSITEGNNSHKITWTASGAVVIGLYLYIVTKGTGTVTVVLHDSSDNLLATASLTTGSITADRFHWFQFGAAVKLTASTSYHIHVTSTVADTTVQTGTSSNLSTAHYAIQKYSNNLDGDQSRLLTSSIKLETINVPTSLTETTTTLITFVPTYRRLAAVSFFVGGDTAANWTITIHDPNNNLVGSVTVANPTPRGMYRFQFTTPLDVIPGVTYHIHIQCNQTNAIFASSTTLSTGAYFQTHFQVLPSDVDFHTMKVFTNLLCIGGGNVLVTVDDSEVLEPEALVFPIDERIRCLESIGDYLAISTWKGNLSDGTSRIYFWDGVSPTYHAFVTVDGVVNAMRNDGNNMLYILHGTQGNISVYTGGITKMRNLKNINQGIQTYFYPEAIDTLEGILYFGNYGATNSAVDTLIYSYGRSDKDYPFSLNKDYPISTGNYGVDVTIGSVLGLAVDKFFVAWKDDTGVGAATYGVDLIDNTQDQQDVTMTFLRYDANDPNRQKNNKTASLRCAPITANQIITLSYRKNFTGNFHEIGKIDGQNVAGDVGKIFRSFDMNTTDQLDTSAFEIEFKVRLQTNGTTAPKLYSVAEEFEPNDQFKIEDKSE